MTPQRLIYISIGLLVMSSCAQRRPTTQPVCPECPPLVVCEDCPVCPPVVDCPECPELVVRDDPLPCPECLGPIPMPCYNILLMPDEPRGIQGPGVFVICVVWVSEVEVTKQDNTTTNFQMYIDHIRHTHHVCDVRPRRHTCCDNNTERIIAPYLPIDVTTLKTITIRLEDNHIFIIKGTNQKAVDDECRDRRIMSFTKCP